MVDRRHTSRFDPVLLAEVVVIVAFLVLLFGLYLIPAVRERAFVPGIWRSGVLVTLFLIAVGIETYRRRLQRKAAISSLVRDFVARRGAPDRREESPPR